MSKNEEVDPLEALLAFAETEFEKPGNVQEKEQPNDKTIDKTENEEKQKNENGKPQTLTEFDLFGSQDDDDKPSLIHKGDTDSSDDEDNRNPEEQKYNECGKQIKQLLNTVEQNHISSSHYGQPKKRVSTWKDKPVEQKAPFSNHKPLMPILKPHLFGGSSTATSDIKPKDVLIDPFFGIRIVNPLISHSTIVDRMQGREAVQLFTIQRFLMRNNYKEKDWVICGVIVGKSPAKTSQKGSQYSIWTLTDLKGDIKTVGLFMFSSAHKDLWKTPLGTVIGVLNPGVLDKRDSSKDEATLSVDNAQKVMVFGQSKDYGLCKSIKKNGDKCNAIVNLSTCEYCVYHIKQEYQKCSRRSELQANFAGKGLTALRNKVLGKNEVFYAGRSYTAIPAKKSQKMLSRDEAVMNKLNGINVNSNPIVKAKNVTNKNKRGVARHLDISPAQRLRDIELLKRLGGGIESKTNFTGIHSSGVTLESSKSTAVNVINKLKAKKSEMAEAPRLSQYDLKNDLIVNVDGKKSFSAKMSEDVTLKESKTTALSVISKLKAKSNEEPLKDNSAKEIEDKEEQQSIEEMLASFECDEFNYDDDDFNEQPAIPDESSEKAETGISKSLNTSLNFSVSSSSKTLKMSSPKSPSVNGSKNDVHSAPSSSNNTVKSLTNISTPKLSNPSPKTSLVNGTKTAPTTPKLSSNSTPKSVTKANSTTPKLTKQPVNLFSTPKHTSPTVNSLSESNKLNSKSPLVNSAQNPKAQLHNPTTKLAAAANGLQPVSKTPISKTALKTTNGMIIPKLSGFSNKGMVDLSVPINKKDVSRAKLNAISFIQKHGPIKKADPNSTKGSGKKRPLDEILNTQEANLDSAAKKSKLQESEFISDRWKKMMAATSKHQNLIEQHYDEEKEKYFKKLEVKEKMEEKMTTTYKVACKAVKCLKCKYTSFSASDLCKAEGHPLRVFDAMKRFFKCGNCQNRTVSLDIIPTRPCKNCGSGKWEKTGMMKEKIAVVQHALSIRGGEQKFINSNATDASLDLLVPDEGA